MTGQRFLAYLNSFPGTREKDNESLSWFDVPTSWFEHQNLPDERKPVKIDIKAFDLAVTKACQKVFRSNK